MRSLVCTIGLAALVMAGCGTEVFDDPGAPGGPSDPGPSSPPAPPAPSPNVDNDGDGFTGAQGDCNDNDRLINPAAIEVEGIRCASNNECPSNKCVGGYCRCQAAADCSSGKVCSKNEDCAFSGELCKNGRCGTTFLCMQPAAGMPNPGQNVCRDNTDNDCDGKIDEVAPACDLIGQLKQGDPLDFARSMDLCDEERACGPSAPCPGGMRCAQGRCSRVLGARFNSDADPQARAIVASFAQSGPFSAKVGQSMVVLSTGKAVYNPQVTCPQTGTGFSNSATDPDPKAEDPEANDYVELALDIVVPANAQSFDFNFHFFSTEYPEWITSKFNDTFWVQLHSKKFNGNISFDKNGTPIRIKNAFFDICDPDPTEPLTATMCSRPASMLIGTGYANDCTGKGPTSKANGGSTGWLHTSAPVTPGETIKLVFSIFDKGDHKWDSAVLIDNFRWKLAPASNPITGVIE